MDLIEWQAATNTTRWKEKPIHEDAFAIVVGIISQQTVPLVLLLAAAVATATSSPRFPVTCPVKRGGKKRVNECSRYTMERNRME